MLFKIPSRKSFEMPRFSNPVKNRMDGGNTGAIMGFLPDGVRNHLVAFLAELAGTFLFLFFAFSIAQVALTTTASKGSDPLPNTSELLYIALGFGSSVTVNVWIFYRISGGQLNPAV
jgi:aquaporin related protein